MLTTLLSSSAMRICFPQRQHFFSPRRIQSVNNVPAASLALYILFFRRGNPAGKRGLLYKNQVANFLWFPFLMSSCISHFISVRINSQPAAGGPACLENF